MPLFPSKREACKNLPGARVSLGRGGQTLFVSEAPRPPNPLDAAAVAGRGAPGGAGNDAPTPTLQGKPRSVRVRGDLVERCGEIDDVVFEGENPVRSTLSTCLHPAKLGAEAEGKGFVRASDPLGRGNPGPGGTRA